MLKIQVKDQRREAIWVVERIYSIGSGVGNDLVIDNNSVSLLHAKLITLDDKLYLKDFDSERGCYVNNKKVVRKQLVPGDVFRLGDVEIEVLNPRESITQPALSETQLNDQWSLVSAGSWLAGQEFMITKIPSIIGRSKQCDIVISGTHLSRQHAEVKPQGNLLHVRDLASANGTYINEERVDQAVAKAGDILRLDTYSFEIKGPNIDPNLTKVRSPDNLEPATPKPGNVSSITEKKWKTRPTSPGNRTLEENEISKKQPLLRTFTVVLFLMLISAIGFLIVSLALN